MPLRDLVGHAHLRELLASAASRGTLPASLIFAGPEGVGKRMTAMALAQLVNCLAPRDGDACGACASCTRIARGLHADILVIEPGDTGVIKVDQIRDVVERTGYRPFEGRRRVVIIDDADAMLGEAQNALLKTLEEPPAGSMFVLVTARPDMLLPTVRSRCQRLRFGRLSPGDVAGVLIQAHGYEPGAAHAAASAADGSIGAALEGASEEFADARDAAVQLLESAAGSRDPRRRLDAAKALGAAGRGSVDRDGLGRRLRALASMLRDLGALRSSVDERTLANADMRPELSGLLKAFDSERTLRAFAAVERALAALDRNASPKIVADWIAFQV
jgi:DNA polymerase-3 subunit delta'